MARQNPTVTNNFTATTAPGVTDDNTKGYDIGSRWIDVNADKAYTCSDTTTGAAVWTETTGAGGGGGISNIVEDLTPQLGGDLDANGNNIEGVTPTEMSYLSGITSAVQTQLDAKGVGDVVGPASATDNAIPRYDTTTGKLLQDSGVTIDDSGNINIPDLGNLSFGGNSRFSGGASGFTKLISSGDGFQFFNNTQSAEFARFVNSNGNFGIGTTNPGEKLEVVGGNIYNNSAGTGFFITNRGADTNFNGFQFETGGTTQWSVGSRNDSTEDLHFYNDIDVATRMIIKETTGRVGIGNSSPAEILDVTGNILASGTVLGSNLSGTNTGDQTISDATLSTTDITTNDFSITKHGFVPKGTNVGDFLKDDGTWASIPGGGDALTSNPLSQFAATTSLQLLGVISDETGSGLLVFGTSPNITTPTGIVKGDVGLGNVDNTSNATERAATATLTNKRIDKRTTTIASSATPTPAGDTTDVYTITALAANATFGAPTGTPVNGQNLVIRIKDNATSRTLAYNAIYRAIGVTLPTATTISKTIYLGFIYNSTDSKWDAIAVAEEA